MSGGALPGRFGVVALCALAGAAPVLADLLDDTVADAVDACVAAGALAEACVGEGAEACIALDPEAIALQAGPCLEAEARFWGSVARHHAAGIGAPMAGVPEAFEAYRDAVCAAASEAWPGMTGAGEAWAACRLEVTAHYALHLHTIAEAGR